MGVRLAVSDDLAIITRARAERRNALTQAMLTQAMLTEVVAAFRERRPGRCTGN